jgi:hypothetical protein
MAGIEDLTNMMMTGTRTDVPPVQGPPVPAGGPPPMAGPVSMGEPRMAANEPRMDPMEGEMSIEGDATALAQAVVGRTGGDIASARAVLAQADMLLAQADNRQPRMAADGGELKVVPEDNPGLSKLPEEVRNRMGYKSMGGPLYAAEGREISDADLSRFLIPPLTQSLTQSGRAMSAKDADMLRQMIMNSVGQTKRTFSNKDISEIMKNANVLKESGRDMSDKDREIALESMRNYRRN